MKLGVINEKELSSCGLIETNYCEVNVNQIVKENKAINEAKVCPNNAGKTGLIELSFGNYTIKQNTKTKDNNMTPQWFELFHIFIANLKEFLKVKLWIIII